MPEACAPTRCGTVALAGRPNAGKSTLFNRLVGRRLSSVTHKPQTTRYNVRGIVTERASQTIFVDTPGLQRSCRGFLSRVLNANAANAVATVDVVVLVTPAPHWSTADEAVFALAAKSGKDCVLAFNKVDLLPHKERLLPVIERLSADYGLTRVVPVSARTGAGVARLQDEIAAALPEADFLFPPDQSSDRAPRFIAAELIREQVMRMLHQEIPYSIHVEVESFDESASLLRIAGVLYVDKPRRRGIVIGAGGARLGLIGSAARKALARAFGRRVFLKLEVRVKPRWRDDPAVVRGYLE